MTKYDGEFKRSVVQDYLADGGGCKALAAKYGVHHEQIRRWVETYRHNGDSGLIKKFSHYSAEKAFIARVTRFMFISIFRCPTSGSIRFFVNTLQTVKLLLKL
jgi:transposase-like protein